MSASLTLQLHECPILRAISGARPRSAPRSIAGVSRIKGGPLARAALRADPPRHPARAGFSKARRHCVGTLISRVGLSGNREIRPRAEMLAGHALRVT